MASLVTNKYLSSALLNGSQIGTTTMSHRHAGNLMLPSGRLVACDPIVFPETEPFELMMPKGSFPVVLSIAMLGNDQRVAFATARLRDTSPVAWDMMTLADQDSSTLKPDEIFGYPVDAGTGCFMDAKAARDLQQAMKVNPDYYETLIAEFDKTYVPTWSWTNLKLGNGEQNLVAFTSGFGDGFYASYAGFDEQGEVSAVVTDFGVVPMN